MPGGERARKGRKGAKGKRGGKGERGSALEEKLLLREKMAWEGLKRGEDRAITEFAEGYKAFLTEGKSLREAARAIVAAARAAGFRELGEAKRARAGARLYTVNRGKGVALAVMGKRPISEGVLIIASHIDAPRLDLKQKPLYEDSSTHLALFKTHYYGGIKKYQWVNHPMSLHGTVSLRDGKTVEFAIGEREGDPVFTVPDLLPHLWGKSQATRKADETVKGEELNLIVGSRPVDDKKAKEKVKLLVLDHLNREYGIVEEDLISAEVEAVPAGPARDVGFDRSMVGAYGQDDRSCAYTAMRAILGAGEPDRTCIALFVDKEEIGSESNTSMKSRFFLNFVGDLMALQDPAYRESDLRRAMSRSKCLSADVNAALDPTFKDVHEAQNAALLGRGVTITKYTGGGGKYNANDATAEYVGEVRRLFNKAGVRWQYGALGKVDEGGGGTVAKFLAEFDMDVVDIGPALLSMHSPFELSSKADIYHTHKAFVAFYGM
jgi:aspartyl aminopeptidase